MAAITVPRPGTDFGPCVKLCVHKDCAQHRADATRRCSICTHPIGYGRPWVFVNGAATHDDCARIKLEGAR